MVVDLYTTTSEKIRLNKSLGTAFTLSAVLSKDSYDVTNPTIELSYDSGVLNKNYCYIAEYGRYYFIEDMQVVNHMIIVKLHVDVLMTYASAIKSSVGHVTRSTEGNVYIPDSIATQTDKTNWQWRSLGTCFISSNDYIMIKGGKH